MNIKEKVKDALFFIELAKMTNKNCIIVKYKRKYRALLKRISKEPEYREYYNSDGESIKYMFEIEADSRELAQEYCDDLWVRIYADYSPTGRWYTRNITFAHKKDNTYLIFHTMTIDV